MVRIPDLPQLTFPLSADELDCFGWAANMIVVATVGPDGKRSIPTRELTHSGEYFYGEVSTSEPPPGVSDEDWVPFTAPMYLHS